MGLGKGDGDKPSSRLQAAADLGEEQRKRRGSVLGDVTTALQNRQEQHHYNSHQHYHYQKYLLSDKQPVVELFDRIIFMFDNWVMKS